MSILGTEELNALIKEKNLNDRLIITPLLNSNQIGESSIDIRLGNDFIITKKANISSIDPAQDEVNHLKYQDRLHIDYGKKFYLHPNELVLANTLEYFRLPTSIAGYVTSRSSWGRAGLVIATAVAVHPGFTGSITLELVNLGEVPLVLYPGLKVAQIVLLECKGGKAYSGRFGFHTDPHFASVNEDKKKDKNFWISGN